MSLAIEKGPNDPRLFDTLQALKTDIMRSLNAVKIGEIQSFDVAKKTAQIQILFKRILANQTIQDYPVLVDCPVFTLQGGGGAIQFPIAAGDQCLVLFSDRNLDAWFATGSAQPPLSSRCHDLSDGIALVGLNSLTSTLTNYDDNVNLLLPEDKKLVVSGGDSAEILGTSLLALKSDVDDIMDYLDTIVSWANSHVHTCASPGSPSSAPTSPETTTPPTMVGTTKLKGS